MSQEQIQRELTEEQNKYDVMVETRDKNLAKVSSLLYENPGMTRADIGRILGVSKRTCSRYIAEIRLLKKKGSVVTLNELQLEERDERVKKMKKILRSNPSISRRELCEQVGVSAKTLRRYLQLYWTNK